MKLPQLSLRELFLLVALAAMTGMGCASHHSISPHERPMSSLGETGSRVKIYARTTGKLPTEIVDLPVRPNYRNDTFDGWNRPLIYESDSETCTLKSLGKDGVPGGSGDDADILRKFRFADGSVEEIFA